MVAAVLRKISQVEIVAAEVGRLDRGPESRRNGADGLQVALNGRHRLTSPGTVAAWNDIRRVH